MIDLRTYGFGEQHQQVYDMAWRYAREWHHPRRRRMDDDDWFPADEYRRMGEVGLRGTTVPESLGGPGLDLVSQFFIGEALSCWNNMLGASWGASPLQNPSDGQGACHGCRPGTWQAQGRCTGRWRTPRADAECGGKRRQETIASAGAGRTAGLTRTRARPDFQFSAVSPAPTLAMARATPTSTAGDGAAGDGYAQR